VTNAARATQAGRIAIDARREGDWLVLSVSDTGCGIAPEKHAAIFDAFEQVGKQTLGESGIGLGLAIVRQLVEVLDGEIFVESALGSGATFTVRLPAWRPPQTPLAARDPLVEAPDAESVEDRVLVAPGVAATDDAPGSLAGGSASAL
jgi:signal transduction histidine kinase